jgi:outer membrane protein OmpA-like peptidoglycan-associated protein
MKPSRDPRQVAILGVLLLVSLLIGPGSARAQLRDQRHLIEVGLFLGPAFVPKLSQLGQDAPRDSTYAVGAGELGVRAGWLPIPWVGAELEVAALAARASDRSVGMGGLRVHAIGQYPEVWKGLTPFVLAGFGLIGVGTHRPLFNADTDPEFHWGFGAKYYVNEWVVVRFDFRHTVSDGWRGNGASWVSLLLGASVMLNFKKDTDRDGVLDKTDKCVRVPGLKPSGCPDRDKDGITDERDQCPDLVGVEPDGCPPDTDGDGLRDDKDECPKEAGPKPHGCPDADGDGFPDKRDACPREKGVAPDGCPPDTDKDGLRDPQDECPTEAGPKPHGCPDRDNDTFPDKRDKCPDEAGDAPDGCPKDTDGDGVPDYKDKCPTVKGLPPTGCPKEVQRFSGTIEGITFEYRKAVIRPTSFGLLDAAVAILKKYPDLRLKVRGHTDDRGRLADNLKLSLQRAEAVKAYFVGKGIQDSRLEVEGVGPKEPVDPAPNEAARAKNRRTEFVLLK